MTLQQIAHYLQGFVIQSIEDSKITNLLLDSRNIFSPQYSLFFAIKGVQHDGHNFIEELIKKGVTQFVIEKDSNVDTTLRANFIVVENTTIALQKLAECHRNQFDYSVIGITGSNGKTIVKEWLAQLLSATFNVVKSPKSYNSQIGVPLSIWEMNENHELAIFEAGISQVNEMQKLEQMIQPTIGILTNLGTAHAGGFKDKKQKLAEKLSLFKSCKILIYSLNDEWLNEELKDYSIPTFSWGNSSKAIVWIQSLDYDQYTTLITYQYQQNIHKITLPFTDKASIENALHCLCTLLYLNVEIVQKNVDKLKPISMRLEVKKGIYHSQLIDDSYNNDFLGLKIAVDFLSQQAGNQLKTIVLSDILDTFSDEEMLYQQIALLLKEKEVDLIIGIGEQLQKYSHFFNLSTICFSTVEKLLQNVKISWFENRTILVKGARTYQFEKIIHEFEQKNHQTVFEINLKSLEHNLNYLRSKLSPQIKTMAMVKAFGYGSGSAELIFALQFHKVDYLAVAYVDEGISLREQGVTMPIMVMNPEVHAFEKMLKFGLEPEIYSLNHLRSFLPYVSMLTKIHLKLDTGMHRLGFEAQDLSELCSLLIKNPFIYVQSVFSHLVGADEENHDDFTNQQIATFEKLTTILKQKIERPFWKHILNSAGVQRFPSASYDLVRLGVALYGIGVNEEEQKQLIPIGTLKTHISQLKVIPKGETIGYGRKGVAEKKLKIATIAIGYADGFDRRFSNQVGKVVISGKLCKVIGNVCMDMTMIDVSHLENVKERDEVIVYGEQIPIYEQAKKINTISYELLTKISNRVKRIFYTE